MKYTILYPDASIALYPDGSVVPEFTNRRAAFAAARRILGVSRLVHDDQRRPTGGGTYWLHESRELECGSLELVEEEQR